MPPSLIRLSRLPLLVPLLGMFLSMSPSARASLPGGVQMNLSKMITDYDRPYVYGLHPGSGTAADSYLLRISAADGQVVDCLPAGTNATDFTINRQEGRMYISNPGLDQTLRVDLDTFTLLTPLRLGSGVVLVNAGVAGTLFFEDDEYSPELYRVNTTTGAILGNRLTCFGRGGEGEFAPAGNFYYHADFTSSNSEIRKFDARGSGFSLVKVSRRHYAPGGPFHLSSDGALLFWSEHLYDSNLNYLRRFPAPVHASALAGQLAITSTQVLRTESGHPEGDLPFETTVLAVAGDSSNLILFDPVRHRLVAVPIAALADLPPPSPLDGDNVLPGEAATLTWPAHPEATSYLVYFSDEEALVAGRDPSAQIGNPATNSLNLPGLLAPGTTHYWRAVAQLPGGAEEAGEVWSFTITYPQLLFDESPVSSYPDKGLGSAIALNDHVCVSGIPGSWNGGHVQIYERTPRTDTWRPTTLILNPDPAHNRFGNSVAVNSRFIAIGSPGEDSRFRSGKVTIYEKRGGAWELVTTLLPSGPEAVHVSYGYQVRMDERHLVVSAPELEVRRLAAAGALFVYEVGTWDPLGTLPHPQPAVNRSLGLSLALHGDAIAAGDRAPGDVYIFGRDPGTRQWAFRRRIPRPAGADDSFGAQLHLAEGFLAIAELPQLPDSDPGRISFYERNPEGSWPLMGSLRRPNASTGTPDLFGSSIAVEGNRLFVGSPGSPSLDTDGEIHSFHIRNDGATIAWDPLAKLNTQIDTGGYNRGLGVSLATAGDYMVAGLPSFETATSDDGALLFYQIATDSNHPPVITSDPFSGTAVGSSYLYRITLHDEDPEDTPVALIAEAPPWLSIQPGADGSFLLTGTPPPGSEGTHNVILDATDDAGGTTSQIYNLEVSPGAELPVVTDLSPDTAAYEHQELHLFVKATSPGPILYQWFHDDIAIPGATDPDFYLDPLTPADAGTYRVTLQNGGGTATSEPILLTVDSDDRLGGNWNTYGKSSSRTGYYPATLRNHLFLPVWSKKYVDSSAVAQPAIVNGQVFVTGDAGNAPAVAVALDLESGQTLWQRALDPDGTMNPLTYHKGRLYFDRNDNGNGSSLFCLEASTGTILWEAIHYGEDERMWAPAVNDEGIYFATGGNRIFGYQPDGTRRFLEYFQDSNFDYHTVSLGPNGRLFSWVAGYFEEHNLTSGVELWSHKSSWSSSDTNMQTVPAISGNRAVVNGRSYVQCYNLATKQVLWRANVTNRGSPAIAGRDVFVFYKDTVRALSLETGQLLKTYQTGSDSDLRNDTQPIVMEDVVLVATDTTTYVFDRASGAIRQEIPAGGNITFADGYLLTSLNGFINAYYANRAPQIAGTPAESVDEDEFYSARFDLIEEDGETITASVVGLPQFLSWTREGNSIVISGTPLAEHVGVHAYSIRAQDPNRQLVTRDFAFEVLFVDDPPTTVGIPAGLAEEDSGPQRLNLRDYFDDEEDLAAGLTYELVPGGPDPGGLLASPQIVDGVLTFDLVPDANGTAGYRIRATDTANQSVEADFVMEILPVDDPPVADALAISGALLAGATLASHFTYTDLEEDAPGDHLYQWFRADQADGSGRIDIPGATSASYLPTAGDVGKHLGFDVTPVAATGDSPTGLLVTSTTLGPIDKATTSLTITADTPDPSFAGEVVTLQFTLSYDSVLLTGAPSGTFAISAPGASPVVVPVSAAGGSIVLPRAGTQDLTVSYSGDGSFHGSSDTESHAVHSQVWIALDDPANSAEDDAHTFRATVTRNGDNDIALVVNLTIAGSAALDADYVLRRATTSATTIPAGGNSVTISLETLVENLEEADETIILTLQAGARYSLLAGQTIAIATILNDDASPIAVADPLYHVVEDSLLSVPSELGVLANDTDQDDGDGPNHLTAHLREDALNGVLLLRPDGSFDYAPDPDYFGPDSFTYVASDGTNFSDPIQVALEVTELVDLRLASTASRDVVGAPGSVTHTVTLENLGPSDGTDIAIDLVHLFPPGVTQDIPTVSRGSVSAHQWLLDLAEDQSATLQVTYGVSAAARGGIDVMTTSAMLNRLAQPLTNEGDDSTTVSSSIISPADLGVLALNPTPDLSLQSGLFTQQLTITNNNPLPLAGFRLLIGGLPGDVQVYNAHGRTPEGVAYIESDHDLGVGEAVTFTIEFFRPTLDGDFSPSYSIETVVAEDPAAPSVATSGADIDRLVVLESGDFLLEFTTTPGSTYAIEYSQDMVSWHRVVPPVTATANRTQWIDSGPPKTASEPSSVTNRFYRIVNLPNTP